MSQTLQCKITLEIKTRTWVSRSIRRSAETLGSMPTLQCLAIALPSSVSIENGGSIPVIY